MKIVILDNYDSFTYNLYQHLGEIGGRPVVFRNDKISLAELQQMRPSRIIISPGPGTPEDPTRLGVCREAILRLGPSIPVLGVCLGHQGIITVFGGRVVRARQVMHGKTSRIYHNGDGLFAGLPQPFEAMRYHSLVGEPATLPDCLEVTARTDDGVIMGVRHREYPIHGVQFHPESIGTTVGKRLLRNFVEHSWPLRKLQDTPGLTW